MGRSDSQPVTPPDDYQPPAYRRRSRPLHQLLRSVLYLMLWVMAGVFLLPFVILICGSVKTQADFNSYLFLPPLDRITFQHYVDLFTDEQMPFARYIANSMFVTSLTVLLQLVFCSLGGFALAKYQFRGKKAIMMFMLMTMMIPAPVLLAPLYELIFHMRLLDTQWGLIVPSMVSVFGIFLFRQSMLSIPDDLLQAGRIDGCSELRLWWSIALPVSRPMIGAFCLISFMGTWNSFLWPQIILSTRERFTLPIGLSQTVGIYRQDFGLLMAGTFISVLPVILLFFLLQREFMRGLTAGAVKG